MQVISTPAYPRYPPYRLPTGQPVAVVGEVLTLDEARRRLILQADLENNVKIEVVIPEAMQCAQLRDIKYLQVRGQVQSSNEIVLKEYCNFKDNFDLKTYNEVLKLSTDSQFRNIFGLRL